ncbi:hypothetical protein [Prauserella cavernicola]|uniref:Uncharacterized protein n=1 Tax=Prauserella cavernicola TaxID=2800127 RepID=A0A934V3Y0_9PSEU|nr:hypothetical protein [Prauserella cavernicola]MBK1787781.1 hypothetical protein [Prauserella cavernicola]
MDESITVERVRHALVVGKLDADGAAVLLAANLPHKRDRTFVVVGDSSVGAMTRLDPWVLADLADEANGDLCVVAPDFGAMGQDGTLPPARLLADRLGVEVTAADGTPVALADGSVFVPGRSAGWVSYRPGGTRTRVGARLPAPWWQDGLPTPSEDSISVPVGLWVRRPGAGERPADPLLRRVPDPDRMYVVLGAPGERPPETGVVVEVLRSLPDENRDRAVLAWYGTGGTAQEVAEELGAPIRVAHGVPGDGGLVHSDDRGEVRWRPFAVESVYRPGSAPVLDRWVAPPSLALAEPGSYRLTDGWRVDVVPRGLVVRPESRNLDLSGMATVDTGPHADVVFVADGPVSDEARSAFDRLLRELPADTRKILRILPADAASEEALAEIEASDRVVPVAEQDQPAIASTSTRTAAQAPRGALVVTADGRLRPAEPILAPVADDDTSVDIQDGVLTVAPSTSGAAEASAAGKPEQPAAEPGTAVEIQGGVLTVDESEPDADIPAVAAAAVAPSVVPRTPPVPLPDSAAKPRVGTGSAPAFRAPSTPVPDSGVKPRVGTGSAPAGRPPSAQSTPSTQSTSSTSQTTSMPSGPGAAPVGPGAPPPFVRRQSAAARTRMSAPAGRPSSSGQPAAGPGSPGAAAARTDLPTHPGGQPQANPAAGAGRPGERTPPAGRPSMSAPPSAARAPAGPGAPDLFAAQQSVEPERSGHVSASTARSSAEFQAPPSRITAELGANDDTREFPQSESAAATDQSHDGPVAPVPGAAPRSPGVPTPPGGQARIAPEPEGTAAIVGASGGQPPTRASAASAPSGPPPAVTRPAAAAQAPAAEQASSATPATPTPTATQAPVAPVSSVAQRPAAPDAQAPVAPAPSGTARPAAADAHPPVAPAPSVAQRPAAPDAQAPVAPAPSGTARPAAADAHPPVAPAPSVAQRPAAPDAQAPVAPAPSATPRTAAAQSRAVPSTPAPAAPAPSAASRPAAADAHPPVAPAPAGPRTPVASTPVTQAAAQAPSATEPVPTAQQAPPAAQEPAAPPAPQAATNAAATAEETAATADSVTGLLPGRAALQVTVETPTAVPSAAPAADTPPAVAPTAEEPAAPSTGEATTAAPSETTPAETPAAPAAPTAAIEVPEHARSTTEQRRAMRGRLGSRYDVATRAVAQLLSERPGLRFGSGDRSALLAELAVVRVFADEPDGAYDADFYTCLADGLRRLPTARTVVVRGIPEGTDVQPESVLRLPTPVVAAPLTASVAGPAEALIWTTTARRLDGLRDEGGAEVVLSGHTRLRVLAVETTPVRRVLLAEDGSAGEAALTRLRAASAARAAPAEPVPASRWFGPLPAA